MLLREKQLLLFWTLILALLLARSGPDGDMDIASDITPDIADFGTWLAVYLFWVVHVGVGLLLTAGLMHVLQQQRNQTQPTWGLLMGAGLLGASVFTPVALWLDWVGARYGWTEPDGYEGPWMLVAAQEFMALAPVFVGMWLIVQLPLMLAQRATAGSPMRSAEPPAENTAITAPIGLLSRLPPALGTDILMIEADLNYIHITSLQGSTMLLSSLRQAAADLGDKGLLIHRSIWVAKAAVRRVKRKGSQLVVQLSNDTELQVSRRRQSAVVAEFGSDFSR